MSESGVPRKFCTQCSSEIRPGVAFCPSCGTQLPINAASSTTSSPENQPSVSDSSGDPGPRHTTAQVNSVNLGETLQSLTNTSKRRLGDVYEGLRHLLANGLQRFQDLPAAFKIALFGIVVLLVLVFLSPLIFIVAAICFVASIVWLSAQAYRKKPVRNSMLIAAASLVLLLTFGGISRAVYNFGGSDQQDMRGDTPTGTTASDNQYLAGGLNSSQSNTHYRVFDSYVSDEGWTIPVTPGLAVLSIDVETDATTKPDIDAVAEEVLRDYQSTSYDAVSVSMVGPGAGSPLNRVPEATAESPNTTFGEIVMGMPTDRYNMDYDDSVISDYQSGSY